MGNFSGKQYLAFIMTLIIGAAVIGYFAFEIMQFDGAGFLFFYIFYCVIVVMVFRFVNTNSCEKCGKKMCMNQIEVKTVEKYATTMDVDRQIKNNRGEVIREYKETVPAITHIYDSTLECKYCGYRKVVRMKDTYEK